MPRGQLLEQGERWCAGVAALCWLWTVERDAERVSRVRTTLAAKQPPTNHHRPQLFIERTGDLRLGFLIILL